MTDGPRADSAATGEGHMGDAERAIAGPSVRIEARMVLTSS